MRSLNFLKTFAGTNAFFSAFEGQLGISIPHKFFPGTLRYPSEVIDNFVAIINALEIMLDDFKNNKEDY